MTSIFEGQSHKTRPFPTQTRVIWVPGPNKMLQGKCTYLALGSNKYTQLLKKNTPPKSNIDTKTDVSFNLSPFKSGVILGIHLSFRECSLDTPPEFHLPGCVCVTSSWDEHG